MKEQLENAIRKYFEDLIERRRFRLKREDAYSMGALKEYECEEFIMQIVNDKGIVTLEVAPKSLPDKTRGIAQYKELLVPPLKGHWNLSLEEQASFLETNWDWFVKSLSVDHANNTLELVDESARKRA